MENSKKNDRSGPVSTQRLYPRRRFTLDALAEVLSAELRLTPDSPLYLAYSGGLDSHVLLHALAHLREHAAWQLTAFHIDHGLQPNSAEWARRCAAVCAALDVPCHSERVVVRDVGSRGLEDAARRARYAALALKLPPGAVLLTAHHQNDQAETLLLQLLRGAGVAGLAAMPALADFARGRLARPLLGFERRALADYAAEQKLQWIEDSSNRDEGMARNFLRHRIWPTIVERWPQAAERLALAARHQADAASLLHELGDIDLATVADAQGDLCITALKQLSSERQANVVRRWIRTGGMTTPGERVLREILTRVGTDPQTRYAVVGWRGGEVRRYRDRLVLARSVPSIAADWEVTWDPTTVLEIPGTDWRLRSETTTGRGLVRSRLAGNVMRVRLRRGGERCRLRGHTHKLKKLLQEAGVPPWERARLPLIYVGENLAAIGDRWICEPYAALPEEPAIAFVLERSDAR
jgi:tRNA(Ile)-lysidine synthase